MPRSLNRQEYSRTQPLRCDLGITLPKTAPGGRRLLAAGPWLLKVSILLTNDIFLFLVDV
jgi:hypothetical protein